MQPIKILLNLSTLNKGGAIQVALSVLQACLQDNTQKIDWLYAVSDTLMQQIALPTDRTQVFVDSPSKNKTERKRLTNLADQQQVDAVFTLFGPAYVKFAVPHLCGVADGWVTHSDARAYRCLGSLKVKIYRFLLSAYKSYWYRQADYWVVEAEVAKLGLMRRWHVNGKKIAVVPNAVSYIFAEYLARPVERHQPKFFKILMLGAAYEHKNYQLLPLVIAELVRQKQSHFKFTLTLPHDNKIWLDILMHLKREKLDSYVENIGVQNVSSLPDIYQQHDILFFPTLLETFSATPLEALCMNMPLVISNIPANQEIAEKCAVYFNPEDAIEGAKKLSVVMHNYAFYVQPNIIKSMHERARIYGNFANRYSAYKKLLLGLLLPKKLH